MTHLLRTRIVTDWQLAALRDEQQTLQHLFSHPALLEGVAHTRAWFFDRHVLLAKTAKHDQTIQVEAGAFFLADAAADAARNYFVQTQKAVRECAIAGVKMLSAAPKMWASLEVAVVHYVHRPKPWEAELSDSGSPISTLARRMRTHEVMHEWRRLCPRGSRNRA